MGRDVHLRLLLTHLGVTLLGLLLLGAVFAVVLRHQVSATHESDLRQETAGLAAQLDRALNRNVSRSTMQRLIRQDSHLMGKRIVVLGADGHATYDSRQWTPFSAGSWRLNDLQPLHRAQWIWVDHNNRLGFQAPLFVHGHLAGAVALLLTASAVAPTWGTLLPPLLLVLAFLLLVGVLIGAYLTRALSRPLRQVSEALTVVTNGQYHLSLPEQGWSEARELTRRYNDMVAEVARSHQTLRDFMANAAHELKTPVALVTGYARALSDGTAVRGGVVGEAVATIQSESEHLARIVEQLFALSSLTADPDAVCPRPCSPGHLAARVTTRFEPRALKEGKYLVVDTPSTLPRCSWDEDRIASMLANLLDNALDHTRSGDTITLRLQTIDGGVLLCVEDSGAGIAAADIPHLFERFYRGPGRIRSEGHAGLGLALVHEIVQRHGGSITVTSEVGKGTSFSIHLPVNAELHDLPTRVVTA